MHENTATQLLVEVGAGVGAGEEVVAGAVETVCASIESSEAIPADAMDITNWSAEVSKIS